MKTGKGSYATTLYDFTLKENVYYLKLIHSWYFNSLVYLVNHFFLTAPGKLLTAPGIM